MGLQAKTRQIIESAVSQLVKFERGNVYGEWKDQRYYSGAQIGRLDRGYAKVLGEHSKKSALYVLYSYGTPMAWYVETEGKWYYVDEKYSASTGQHQSAYRWALKGKNVVTLFYMDNEVCEMGKEYY